jgi:hypothetical protein
MRFSDCSAPRPAAIGSKERFDVRDAGLVLVP